VVVIDASAGLRRRLTSVIAKEPDIDVVAEGNSGEQAARLVRDSHADVVVLDLAMPVTGWAAMAALKRTRPLTRVVVLTALGEHIDAQARRAGAHAVVRKSPSGRDVSAVLDAIRRVSG